MSTRIRQHELTRRLTASRILKTGFLLVILVALFGELTSLWNRGDYLDANADSVVNKPQQQLSTTTPLNSIAPGELPGYTGWARPEHTLARNFWVSSQLYKEVVFVVSVECRDCATQSNSCSSRFFLRAYGPAVVPGIIQKAKPTGNQNGCSYDFSFSFYDPGFYTIEAVLTVSNPPPMEVFPLDDPNQEEPNYEGYLLPGFPLTGTIAVDTNPPTSKSGLCQFEDLVETSPNSALEKARWKVTGRVNAKDYWSKTMNSSLVSTLGYMTNVNSLGINMEYQYVNDCRLIQEESLMRRDKRPVLVGGCQGNSPQEKLHIVYIGDSVMRVQKDTLQRFLKGIPSAQVETTFLSLHGGYRKNQVLGPANVTSFLQDLKTKTEKAANENVVILFNTGLHDIHRLCGAEFRDERPTYLDKKSLKCVDEYKLLLKDFVTEINDFPAALKVFQSTTAAWPKYGNYGIDWKQNGQGMVLVSDFCEKFNEIVFEVLSDFKEIQIMDGYWITYARPDNREIGDIGKKLSHPGVEVLSAMTRKWIMLMMDKVCLPLVV